VSYIISVSRIIHRFVAELSGFPLPDLGILNLQAFRRPEAFQPGAICRGWRLPSDLLVTQHCRFDETGRGEHAATLHVWDPAEQTHLVELSGLPSIRQSFYESPSRYHEMMTSFGGVWELEDGRIVSEVTGSIDSDGIQFEVGTVVIWDRSSAACFEEFQDARCRVTEDSLPPSARQRSSKRGKTRRCNALRSASMSKKVELTKSRNDREDRSMIHHPQQVSGPHKEKIVTSLPGYLGGLH
jgi:hypothetical protein